MDADAFFAEVQRRLVVLAEHRPFRFVATTRRDAAEYLAPMTTFIGYSEGEIAAAERVHGAKFPRVFRSYLRRMGAARGELFCGSDVALLDELAVFRGDALELLRESGVTASLPENAIVFLFHQGYQFLYVLADDSDDGPVHVFVEGDRAPHVLAASFVAFTEAELALCENNHRALHENGGFYVTIRDGSVTKTYPALASGDRALDGPDQFIR